jgi:hypothetical protein
MKLDKLYKRFLKDNMVFGGDISKGSMLFMNDFNEAFLPFNSFRWDLTEEGHVFWFTKALEWIMYLYTNYDNIDDEDVEKYDISIEAIFSNMKDLIENYSPKLTEEELMKIKAYSEIKSIISQC